MALTKVQVKTAYYQIFERIDGSRFEAECTKEEYCSPNFRPEQPNAKRVGGVGREEIPDNSYAEVNRPDIFRLKMNNVDFSIPKEMIVANELTAAGVSFTTGTATTM